MVKRVITGAVFTVVILAGIALQGWVLRLLLLFAMLLSLSEMYRAFRKIGADPVRWAGYVYCCLAVFSQSLYSQLNHPVFREISPPMLALTLSLLLAMTVIIVRGKLAFDSLLMTVFPMLYPGLFFSLMITLQDLNTRFASTVALILMFFIASVAMVSKPTLLQSRSPTTQMMHMSESTVTVPYFFNSLTMSLM